MWETQTVGLMVRPTIAPAVVRLLERDTLSPEGLIEAIREGEPIDLAAPRSAEAAEFDGEDATVAGYFRALCRDKFLIGGIADLHELIALGTLAADIEAEVPTTERVG